MKTAAVALLLLVSTTVSPGAALRCWTCSSLEGGYCSDPFNSSVIVRTTECGTSHHRGLGAYGSNPYQPPLRPICKKVKQMEHGAMMFVRSCGFESYVGEACGLEQMSHDGDRRRNPRHHRDQDNVNFCETCFEDGCNAAGVPAASLLAAVLSAAVATFIARLE